MLKKDRSDHVVIGIAQDNQAKDETRHVSEDKLSKLDALCCVAAQEPEQKTDTPEPKPKVVKTMRFKPMHA